MNQIETQKTPGHNRKNLWKELNTNVNSMLLSAGYHCLCNSFLVHLFLLPNHGEFIYDSDESSYYDAV